MEYIVEGLFFFFFVLSSVLSLSVVVVVGRVEGIGEVGRSLSCHLGERGIEVRREEKVVGSTCGVRRLFVSWLYGEEKGVAGGVSVHTPAVDQQAKSEDERGKGKEGKERGKGRGLSFGQG